MLNSSCPIPITDYPTVTLAHGGGGTLMHQLINKMFRAAFTNPLLDVGHDGAVFSVADARLAMTTDSYVVRPLFFPGGDIGTLAVNGTVNDLAMCGARPLYLTLGLILEEGLPMEELWSVVQSIRDAAEQANVRIVTGDTKVVDQGKGDGIYLNTAGIGVLTHDRVIGPSSIEPGDAILLSGDVGRHGVAIMAVREGLAFESEIESDCAPVAAPILAMIEQGIEIHSLRDLTRGGLASALVEHARDGGATLEVSEAAIPVREDVQGACEMLGLDPMYVANEGRFMAVVRSDYADQALEIMRSHTVSAGAVRIGEVKSRDRAVVHLRSHIGAMRIVDMLSGEQLPRIC